jgi:hypothetical protein
MLDSLLLKKSFDLRVLELRSIITSNLFLFLIRTHFDLVFFLEKEYPSEARIVIHNYKTILTLVDAYVKRLGRIGPCGVAQAACRLS